VPVRTKYTIFADIDCNPKDPTDADCQYYNGLNERYKEVVLPEGFEFGMVGFFQSNDNGVKHYTDIVYQSPDPRITINDHDHVVNNEICHGYLNSEDAYIRYRIDNTLTASLDYIFVYATCNGQVYIE